MISIVIPVYNIEQYIQECIDSITSQSYSDFEVILVDDGSNDRSGSICDAAALKDDRIKVFHKKNGGAGSARKFGVKHSVGEWIVFVDGDDVLPEGSLEAMIQCSNGGFDIIAGTLSRNGIPLFMHQTGEKSRREYVKALLLGQTPNGPYAKLIKRQLFESIVWDTPEAIIQNEDLLMLLALASQAERIKIANDVICYNYMIRPNSASSQTMSYAGWLLLFELIRKSIIADINEHKDVEESYFLYRIRRIYTNVILKGLSFQTSDPVIQELIGESASYSLDKYDSRIIRLLKSKPKRVLAYWQRHALTLLKRVVKTIIGKSYA